jgi:4'-phosphopantetheinyl transferase EntD
MMRWRGGLPCGNGGLAKMPDASAFAERLRSILPDGASLGAANPAHLHPLAKGEDLPGAIPLRLAEYSAGRAAARIALRRADQPIPMGADRAPVWPEGIVGSITHCAGLCLAVVAKDTNFQGLGLDVEPAVPIAADLWETILHPLDQAKDGLVVLHHFVAKEAVYKAQYALSKQVFGFDVLRMHFAGDHFEAEFCADIGSFAKGTRLQGDLISAGGFLGAFVALRQLGRAV